MTNYEVAMTLDQCVSEVMNMLHGLDLQYQPELDRYRSVTLFINRALRANALEREWSYYSSTQKLGQATEGMQSIDIPGSMRPRIIGGDAVRLRDENDVVRTWAYFLPRDELEKYPGRSGLWVAITRQTIKFSRPISSFEAGWTIEVPVMREPIMFRLPEDPTDDEGDLVTVPDSIRDQLIDFHYPDVVLLRAAWLFAQTDPVMQPRAQTLEGMWKDQFYQLNERDDRNTDHPYMNEWTVPIQSDIFDVSNWDQLHPHADERR